eukprot:NODE_699_length_1414_cov_208.271062_g518_i0.p1 GENE.NODE_699_length_1414_cov_208.271062_g518_i0~~NODE_699_length_1414_cov_208.271062_g518_i0.p1  ORF type:complete len:402 (+),score=134.60 NODE_699_length_1414_cov_208.271062_g518_i0:79-1206(+)
MRSGPASIHLHTNGTEISVNFLVWWSSPTAGCSMWIQGDAPQLETPLLMSSPPTHARPFSLTALLPVNNVIQWWVGIQAPESKWIEWSPKRRQLWTSLDNLVTNWMLWGADSMRGGTTSMAPMARRVASEGNLLRRKSSVFFAHLQEQSVRDYVVLVDRSVSMRFMGKWEQARQAVEYLAPYVCKCDPDGITLYLFDHKFQKWDNVTSASVVSEAFTTCPPRGSTNLADVLQAAFDDHFEGTRRATTILVVTDGEPDSREPVKEAIVNAANKSSSASDLRISFIQIGNDAKATAFLKELDDDLEVEGVCKHDIVDTINFADMAGQSFDEYMKDCLKNCEASSPSPDWSDIVGVPELSSPTRREQDQTPMSPSRRM